MPEKFKNKSKGAMQCILPIGLLQQICMGIRMGIVYVMCLVALAGTAFLARGEPAKSKKFFYKSASFLVRNIKKKNKNYEKTAKDMKALYPGRDIDKKVQAYYTDKVRKVLMLAFAGTVLSLGIYLHHQQEKQVTAEGVIHKQSWKEGDFLIDLQAWSETAEEISVLVEPRSFTEGEAKIFAEEAFSQLAGIILGKNSGTGRVTEKLNLVSQLENYPFQISWESNNPQIIKPTGEVENKEVAQEGELVILTACLTYKGIDQDFRYVKEIQLQVYPAEQTPEEKWRDELLEAIESSKAESAYEEMLQLPEMIRGTTVQWKEKPKKDSTYLWILVILSAIALYLGQDSDLHKKAVKRKRQLERDYPDLVSKLALYLGAGMTVKNAWRRILQDYIDKERSKEDSKGAVKISNKAGSKIGNEADRKVIGKEDSKADSKADSIGRSALGEEMLVSWRELENGVSESEVYFRFGKRLGGSRYRKLSGLLCNHLQKGNKNLLQVLWEEADLALEERKNTARVVGEEMGTRLLFPMMIMLLIVMIIIMVPAYTMF